MVAICHQPARSPVRPCTPHRQPERYARRRPERTPRYRVVASHFETWLAERSLGEHPVAAHVEEEFRAYLRSRLLSFGFARARCGTCGHDFLIAFSCKGRGICPSCNGRRIAQTAAHLVDHVIPPVPVRQWVISVPKILAHVGEPVEPPPVSPARGPPTEWTELVQVHDDRDGVQDSLDEFPVIDIHSL